MELVKGYGIYYIISVDKVNVFFLFRLLTLDYNHLSIIGPFESAHFCNVLYGTASKHRFYLQRHLVVEYSALPWNGVCWTKLRPSQNRALNEENIPKR